MSDNQNEPGKIRHIHVIRCRLPDTKDLSEKQIRQLCGVIPGQGKPFFKDFWDEGLISFDTYAYDKIINIELPELPGHYPTLKGNGQAFYSLDDIERITIDGIQILIERIHQLNKTKALIAVINSEVEK